MAGAKCFFFLEAYSIIRIHIRFDEGLASGSGLANARIVHAIASSSFIGILTSIEEEDLICSSCAFDSNADVC